MGIPSGTHDPRQFRHYAKMAADGSVAAIVEVADGLPAPTDGEQSLYIDVTDLHPYDFRGVVASAVQQAPVVVTTHADRVPTPDRQQNHAAVRAELAKYNKVARGR